MVLTWIISGLGATAGPVPAPKLVNGAVGPITFLAKEITFPAGGFTQNFTGSLNGPKGMTFEIAGRYVQEPGPNGEAKACAATYKKDIVSLPCRSTFPIITTPSAYRSMTLVPRLRLGRASALTASTYFGPISAKANLKLERDANNVYSPSGLYSLSGDVPAGLGVTDDGTITYAGLGLDFDTGASPKNAYTFTITADNSNDPYPNPAPAGADPRSSANGSVDTAQITLNVTEKTCSTGIVTGLTESTTGQEITVLDINESVVSGTSAPYFQFKAFQTAQFSLQASTKRGGHRTVLH